MDENILVILTFSFFLGYFPFNFEKYYFCYFHFIFDLFIVFIRFASQFLVEIQGNLRDDIFKVFRNPL